MDSALLMMALASAQRWLRAAVRAAPTAVLRAVREQFAFCAASPHLRYDRAAPAIFPELAALWQAEQEAVSLLAAAV